jgi:hypothetical protein
MFLAMCGFFVYWLAISMYHQVNIKRFLVACGQIQASGSAPFGTVNMDSGVGWLLFYDLFALYWNCNFAMAFS